MEKHNLKVRLTVILLFLGTIVNAQMANPYLQWTFDGSDPLKDSRVNAIINTKNYNAKLTPVDGAVGKGMDLNNNNGTALTSALYGKVKTAATIEFYFKGNNFTYQTLPTPHFLIKFLYPYIQFKTTSLVNGKPVIDDWKINLNGAGRKSYDYYADGKWHYWVFMIDIQLGIKKLFIDGESVDGFSRNIKQGNQLVLDKIDGFRNTNKIDQLAFYNSMISGNTIQVQAAKLPSLGNSAEIVVDNREATVAQVKSAPSVDPQTGLDRKEFGPGYPSYTMQATDQLKSFPDPRYDRSLSMKRNFPWLDISYLHRELPGNGGKGFGKTSAAKAVQLEDEMVRRWNYYLEIPTLRQDSVSANKVYTNPSSMHYALIRYAKTNPQYPIASVIMQIQGKPVQASLNQKAAYAISQNLQTDYYLRDANGKPVIEKGKKWLSPLAPLDIIKNDAHTTAFYLRQVTRHIGRPFDMLNENGEIFGHMRPASLLQSDPEVKKDIAQRNLNIAQYNGWFQNRLDTCYKNEVLRELGWKKTLFTFYNVSAYNSTYWPDYAMRRSSNMVINGNHYSTPAFYPARPDNWRNATGQLNGYGKIAEGRKKEIAYGDLLFAPFVSAGWNIEENSVRPAQWLALLKSMVMLGADFFHVGYFNVTGGKGWPNGVGPNDPRGYIYQVAMPAYAQAIGSKVYPFLLKGQLLNPQSNLQADIYTYRFKGIKENQLILVRKMGNSYLIYGSIQPNSNLAGSVQMEEDTRIQLNDMTLQFRIRRQGSMYVFEPGNKPVFYQLDGWHQYEHPYYWSKEVWVEAENARRSPEAQMATEFDKPFDFRNFTTWITLTSGESINVEIPSQERSNLPMTLRVRSRTGNATIAIDGARTVQKTVNSSSWTVLKLTGAESDLSKGQSAFNIKTLSGSIDIDWVKF
ncbi:hypothetical protein [Pseudobacter ginsenosidimutans]|uniref:Uncharacterized protein n=1 Tax=Pseudobacter ginsenosidimutans TaxID=661488 RepID=A0A4Q7MVZ9_9BACT|nr:hypothetical protein [Pseudobacter ginsenosidimutans]QEC41035.1 hypothetical protein FSB84_04755 [Pseudobacter ginsenosidimutans]RZS72214.1 hypothetical protein EV199_4130 [Pseudobacter ginsenosidimutans]